MIISQRVVFKLLLLFSIFATAKCENSSKFTRHLRHSLKELFWKIENDKAVIEQIDDLQLKLRTVRFRSERIHLGDGLNGTFIHSNLTENVAKNRHPHLLCYDHSRVVLSSEGNASDYIHANFVDGFKKKNAFILTQGEVV
jgi:protein tyrosine phosphatase